MQKLTHEDFSQIQSWVHRHARPLELARFRYHFEGPSQNLRPATSPSPSSGQDEEHRQSCRTEFLRLMSDYRNADGGFGHALEPDSWNPDSTPYTTLKALELLDEMALLDKPEARALVQGALAYLEACPFATGDGWPFNIPSNDAHPHAPWWTYDPNTNVYESIGVTTGLCAYILRLAPQGTPLYQKALALTTRTLGDFMTISEFGEMGLGGFVQLFAALRETRLSEAVLSAIPNATEAALTAHTPIAHPRVAGNRYGTMDLSQAPSLPLHPRASQPLAGWHGAIDQHRA